MAADLPPQQPPAIVQLSTEAKMAEVWAAVPEGLPATLSAIEQHFGETAKLQISSQLRESAGATDAARAVESGFRLNNAIAEAKAAPGTVIGGGTKQTLAANLGASANPFGSVGF